MGKRKQVRHPKILREFSQILFSLNDAELALLESDILKRGILDPILVWKGICIDGATRLRIAKKHNLPYETKELHFETKEDAKAYVFEHQAGKRNQTTFSKIAAGLKFEDYYGQKAKANQRLSSGRGKKGCKKVKQRMDTLGIIGKKVGTSRVYVSNTKYILANGSAKTIANCHMGKLSIRNAYLKAQDYARRNRRRRALETVVKYENPNGWINNVHCGDCLKVMKKMIKDGLKGKISLIVFSPPYNNNCNYGNWHNDNLPYKKYLEFLGEAIYLCSQLARPGGRLIIQVDSMTNREDKDKGDNYKHTIYPDLVYKVRELNKTYGCDMKFFTEIVWYKYNGAGKKSAHGSYCSATCPVNKRTHEYILVWSKSQWSLPNITDEPSDLTPEEFNKYIWSVWPVHPIGHKGLDHPAVFPERLIEPIVKMFCHPGDIVLDPFNGSGTTTQVAAKLGRRWIGIDQNPRYSKFAKRRTEKAYKEWVEKNGKI